MLRERTQRRLCRVLFVAGCVLPLAACVGWAIARQTPAYQAALRQSVGDLLGVRCEWSQHATPRPGEHELRGVALFLPGCAEPIATANRLRYRPDNRRHRIAIDSLTIADPSRLQSLVETFQRRSDVLEAHLSTRVLRFVGSDGPSYGDVVCEITGDRGGFTLAAESKSARALLRVSATGSGESSYSVTTGDQALPIAWFATPIGAASGVRFLGVVSGANDVGEATGTLLVAASHRGDGPIRATWTPAIVEVEQASWIATQLQQASVTVDVPKGGYVHRSLLDAATKNLGVKQTGRVAEQLNGEALWYDRFACQLEIDAEGVTLFAGCGEENGKPLAGRIAHAVLQSEGEALLLEPRDKRKPLAALLQTLWPESEAALPATSSAARLASRLPL